MGDVLKSKRVLIGNSSTEILAAPGTTGNVCVVNNLTFFNIDGVNACDVDVTINENGGGDVDLVKKLTIPAGTGVCVFGEKTGKLNLQNEGTADTIDATATYVNDVVAFVNYVERT